MKPADIITAVRDRLGDSKRERWSNETLLLYVSMCQSDICMNAHLFRLEAHITLNNDQLIYTLPSDFMALNRLEYNNMLFPVETRGNIDSNNAVFPCALKDNLVYNEIEIRLGEGYDDLRTALVNAYGVVVDINTNDIDDGTTLDDVHGVIVDYTDDVPLPPEQPLDDLLVYYTAIPPILKMDTTDPENPILPDEELIVPNIWFGAFLHYVCGMALQDDNDANNIERGELENTKYARQLAHIMKTASKDFTSNIRTKLTTKIRRI